MSSALKRLTLEDVRRGIIGGDLAFPTPFGLRHLFYADYTASGRGLEFVEEALGAISRSYANTHTEDDYSGKMITRLLLGIDEATSLRFRDAILCDREGLKPGWVRINLHWVFNRADVAFLLKAIDFIAKYGDLFLRLYTYHEETGEWAHSEFSFPESELGLGRNIAGKKIAMSKLPALRKSYFRVAADAAEKLRRLGPPRWRDDGPDADLRHFYVAENEGVGVRS